MVPSRDRCLELLAQAGCGPEVVDHVQAVAALAVALADRAPEADRTVVLAGALLHDIGRARGHGVDHVVHGVEILRGHGVDERVVGCVASHVGAGIPADQARAWGWPEPESYVPGTVEEMIVCHADNLTHGTTHVRLADTVAKFRDRGLGDDAIERLETLHQGLADRLGVDPDEVSRSLA